MMEALGGCLQYRCLAPVVAVGGRMMRKLLPQGSSANESQVWEGAKEGNAIQGLGKGTWIRRAKGRYGGISGYTKEASHRGNVGVTRGHCPKGGGPRAFGQALRALPWVGVLLPVGQFLDQDLLTAHCTANSWWPKSPFVSTACPPAPESPPLDVIKLCPGPTE